MQSVKGRMMFFDGKSPHHASERKYYGKYPGVVKGNEPPDDKESNRGELLIEVPGIMEQTPNGNGRQPIRVTAKPCFPPGFFFIPRLEDTVWVEFAAGDINVPIWTGVWYPKDKPPKTVDGEAPKLFQKIISTVSGHEILLDDTGGSERIVIRNEKKDVTITLDAKGITLKGDVFVEGVLTVGTGSMTTIDGNTITGG